MSERTGMNRELEQLESELRQVSLPDSTVDREETLYRAGWAAAMASLDVGDQGNERAWFWPATSGVLATVAALLAVLLVLDMGARSGSTDSWIAGVADSPSQGNEGPSETNGMPVIAHRRESDLAKPVELERSPVRGNGLARMDLVRMFENHRGSLSSSSLLGGGEEFGHEYDDGEDFEGNVSGGLTQFELMRRLLGEVGAGG